jgi:serine/threonine protein kinase
VKLIDFGSAVIEDPSKPRPFYNVFYGTTAYASSEVLRKRAYRAGPAEIWTLGVLLSYLLTGSSPFPTESDAIEGRVRLKGGIEGKLSGMVLELMRVCLEPDPDRRATIEEVRNHSWLVEAGA